MLGRAQRSGPLGVQRTCPRRHYVRHVCHFNKRTATYSPLINQCGTANARVQRQHQELANVYKQLGLSSLEGWYGVSSTKIRANGGIKLMDWFGGSPSRMLTTLLPHHQWLPWKFASGVRREFWDDLPRQRSFLDWAMKELAMTSMTGWYNVSSQVLRKLGADHLFRDNDVASVVMKAYPEHPWKPWEFTVHPDTIWDSTDTQRQYFIDYMTSHGLRTFDDWYTVVGVALPAPGKKILRQKYQHSLPRALSTLFPEHKWLPWKFTTAPMNFWGSIDNRRQFFEWAETQLGIKQPSDWYQISSRQLRKINAAGLMRIYQDSVLAALSDTFPEHKWEPWLFSNISQGIWKNIFADPNLRKGFVNYMEKTLRLKDLDDWYRVSVVEMREAGIKPVPASHGGLISLLRVEYPNHSWDVVRFAAKGKRSAQRVLHLAIRTLFGDIGILEEYKDPDNPKVELDFLVPSLKLAFEFQGQQHYQDIRKFSQASDDQRKLAFCGSKGITLIEVPYWWDQSAASLAGTIRESRTELLDQWSDAKPIPTSPV